ncbi:MAG: hypothetical protein Q8K93_12300, partial [Reyranella sp.]|nr:hypothetical protein [Reyranella sp.]
MGPLNLKLILQAVDRASGPTNKVTGAVGGLLGRVTTLGRRMNRLALAGGAIAAAGAAVASVALARSALGMVREAADAGDAAIKTAQKVGLGVVAFQRYAWAANLAGVEQAGLVTGLGLLAQKADGAARGGKEDLKIFARLGISSRRLAGDLKSPGALLEYLADRFAAMPDGATKTAMAMDLFGRSGRDLIPLLPGGGAAMRAAGDAAERLGQVIDEKTGKAAEEFNDNVSRMKGAVAGLRLGIGGALLPTLNSAVVGITAWIGAHRAEILDKVNIAVGRLAAGLSKVDWIKFAEGVGNTIIGAVKLFEWFGGLDGLVTGGLVLGIGKLTLGLVGIAPAIAGMIGVAAGPVGWILLAVG